MRGHLPTPTPWEIGLNCISNIIRGLYTQFQNMGNLHLSYPSILNDKIRPLKAGSKDIVCGGGDGGGAEQHVCKVILVISLSLSQAEQFRQESIAGLPNRSVFRGKGPDADLFAL